MDGSPSIAWKELGAQYAVAASGASYLIPASRKKAVTVILFGLLFLIAGWFLRTELMAIGWLAFGLGIVGVVFPSFQLLGRSRGLQFTPKGMELDLPQKKFEVNWEDVDEIGITTVTRMFSKKPLGKFVFVRCRNEHGKTKLHNIPDSLEATADFILEVTSAFLEVHTQQAPTLTEPPVATPDRSYLGTS